MPAHERKLTFVFSMAKHTDTATLVESQCVPSSVTDTRPSIHCGTGIIRHASRHCCPPPPKPPLPNPNPKEAGKLYDRLVTACSHTWGLLVKHHE